MKLTVWTLIALAVCLLFVGCTDSNNNNAANEIDSRIIGTWVPTTAVVTGTTTEVPLSTALAFPEGVTNQTIRFNEDGTVTITNFNNGTEVSTTTGTFTAFNGTGTITTNGDVKTFTYAFSNGNNTIDITMPSGNTSYTITFNRQGNTTLDTRLVGTWVPTTAVVTGTTTEVPLSTALAFPEGVTSQTTQFNEDGTITFTNLNGTTVVSTTSGTFTAQNGVGTITTDGNVSNFTYQIVDDNTITITIQPGNTSYTVTFVKQGSSTLDTRIVGTWIPVIATTNSTVVPLATALSFPQGITSETVAFAEDGTFTIQNFQNGSPVTPITGTFTASNGVGTFTQDSTTSNFTFAFPDDCPDKLTLTITPGANAYSITFVKQATLTGTALTGIWTVSSVKVNGAAMTNAEFFNLKSSNDIVAIDFKQDGTVIFYETTSGLQIVSTLASAKWATGTCSFSVDFTGAIWNGFFTTPGATTTLTFVDQGGRTVQFDLAKVQTT